MIINGLFFHDTTLILQKEDVIPLIRYSGDIAYRLMSKYQFTLNPNSSNIFVVKVEPDNLMPNRDPQNHIEKVFASIEKQGYDNKRDTLVLMVVSEGNSSWNYQMRSYVENLRPNYNRNNIYFASEQLNNDTNDTNDNDLLSKLSFFNQSIEIDKDILLSWDLKHNIPKDKLFLSFNRRPNFHRTQLVLELINNNLIDRGFVSFCNEIDDANVSDIIDSMHVSNEEKALYKIQLQNSLVLDHGGLHEWDLTSEKVQDYYKRTYFSIVTETRTKEPELAFTEKTFKPIGHKHPFILLGKPGLIKWLHKFGFKTFHPFINESYDDIEDYELRFKFVMSEINRLSNMSHCELENFWTQTKEITEYNFNYLNSDEFFECADYCTELLPFIENFKTN